jgi:hypothetical protein
MIKCRRLFFLYLSLIKFLKIINSGDLQGPAHSESPS